MLERLFRLREQGGNAIPLALKRSISVGIGLFILFIGLVSGSYVKPGTGTSVSFWRFSSRRRPGSSRPRPPQPPSSWSASSCARS
jgi:AGZA family xanthine/uracil permease-like MFS transporter